MKTKLTGIALFLLTLGAVVYYPQLSAGNIPEHPPINHRRPEAEGRGRIRP